ncbi:hypothetical protein [Vibrio salinus]|uniref:hypothetical protein n=1 Tax=Vibrio salinus TaxID=2899784 RepID=UPI001E5253CE|nr:hypothetical protein [Vibrio salinus]MCE0495545.1 hypothetical protein [Vibrio salinus]
MTNIFLGVSGHGYGHLSQVVPVANKLLTYLPDARFYIHCNLPTEVIEERLNTGNFVHNKVNLDIGLVQITPLEYDVQATFKAYQALYSTYSERVSKLCEFFSESNIDLVIADIPFLAIEAASQSSIPSVAIASLSWDKVIQRCLDDSQQEVREFVDMICTSQAKTNLTLHPSPSMKLDSFPEGQSIPPILLEGKPVADLREKMGITKADERKIVLVSLGGMKTDNLPIDALSRDERFHWLINAEFMSESDHLHAIPRLKGIRYRDLVACVDAIVSKPGYGTAVEAVRYQLPFVFTCRGDFPDEPSIVEWLEAHSCCRQISKNEWLSGEFGDYLAELMNQPLKKQVACNGDEIAAKMIYETFFSDSEKSLTSTDIRDR